MAREKSPERIKAKEIYLNAKGNIMLKEIAEDIGVTDVKVRKWKNLDKWDEELKGNVPLKENKKKVERTIKKGTKEKKKKEPIAEEVKELIKNDELTEKQKLFCIYYSKYFNATKAYLNAYTCTYNTAMVEGSKLLRKPNIKAQIDSLTAIEFNRESLKRGVLQKYIDIAFADLGDYMIFGKKEQPVWERKENGDYVPVIDPNTGEQKIQQYSYVELRESVSVDTSLLSEVSEGKFGISIKLIDKMKALDFLNKHLNLLSDKDKVKLDLENKRLQNAKLGAEINKISGPDKEDVGDDGFLEALQGKTVEVWNEQETKSI